MLVDNAVPCHHPCAHGVNTMMGLTMQMAKSEEEYAVPNCDFLQGLQRNSITYQVRYVRERRFCCSSSSGLLYVRLIEQQGKARVFSLNINLVMQVSQLLLLVSSSSHVAAFTRRSTLQPINTSNNTTPQAKRYIIEFEAVCQAPYLTYPILTRDLSYRAQTIQAFRPA